MVRSPCPGPPGCSWLVGRTPAHAAGRHRTQTNRARPALQTDRIDPARRRRGRCGVCTSVRRSLDPTPAGCLRNSFWRVFRHCPWRRNEHHGAQPLLPFVQKPRPVHRTRPTRLQGDEGPTGRRDQPLLHPRPLVRSGVDGRPRPDHGGRSPGRLLVGGAGPAAGRRSGCPMSSGTSLGHRSGGMPAGP